MTAQTILPANTLSSGYDVANSLRFNNDDSPQLHKTPGSAGNQDAWTLSMWIRRSSVAQSGSQSLYGVYADGNNQETLAFDSGGNVDKLYWQFYQSGGVVGQLTTTRLFRDVSAWYNIVISYDSANGTAGNRMRMWINGTEETGFDTDTNPSSGLNSQWNGTTKHQIGCINTTNYFDGYMAEVVSLDGTAVTDASLFGEFDEDSPNIWKPIDVSGLTFGTNGFYLDFEDSSNLGNDANGGTDFTEVNIATTDQSTDTCSNNFCTMNPLNVPTSSGPTFSEGNLVSISTNANFGGSSTIGMTTGKWYCEAKCVTDATIRNAIGITGETGELARDNNAPTSSSSDQSSIGYLAENGNFYNPAAGNQGSSYGDSYANDDIIGIAMDLDNMKLYFSKNGTFQNSGDPTSGATGTGAIDITVAVASTIDQAYFVCQGSAGASTSRFDWNFGSPMYSISSGNSDANGYGNFEFSVPSGYYAWNSKNLSEFG